MGLEKATIANTATGESIEVMFNPEEYTLNREINFAQIAIPGRSAPIIQFVHGQQQSLDMELFLDTYEAHTSGNRALNRQGEDVRVLTRRVTDLMNIEPATHAPPVLVFTWASLSFTCVLSKATQRFVMFRPDGAPVRARLNVTFSQYSNAEMEAKAIKRETADYTKVHIVRQADTLPAIAFSCYGNARLWRPIARRNGIDDPRLLTIGQMLIVPQLPYRDAETGEVFA